MGLSSAVGWWEEWQLRILVLSSLFIQYVLWFSIWIRRALILRRLRVVVWIAYIAGDAVAIYALATLFNRRKQTCDGESSALEVLWAPVLLINLGGQPYISAYSLEDNELWKRHTITLVSQITVALYVFCKWWSGEKTLLAAAILLFILGVIKFAQKPWALKTASFNTMQAFRPKERREGRIHSLEEYVQTAKKHVQGIREDSDYNGYVVRADYMFVDQSVTYSFRISRLPRDDHAALRLLQLCLRSAYYNLYTRLGSVTTALGRALLFLLPFLALASMVLFTISHKDGHSEKDIRVTYIILGCTTVLEFLLPSIIFFGPILGFDHHCWIPNFPYMVSQYNLISFYVRKNKPTFLMKLATFNFLRDFINQHWYVEHVPIAFQITRVVSQHVKDGWNKYIHDAASYRRFSELRGQWAIRRHHQLGWSLKKPFDESVLIWHIATDLCFFHPNTSPQGQQGEATECSRYVSNYMIYLLLIRPEMLLPGTRSDLFTFTSNQIIINSKGALGMTEEILAQEMLGKLISPPADNTISDAGKLAEALMKLDNEEHRWNVIQGVWVEMLCYSASRCRGYLHAKSLGDGVECLTIIWLFLSSMGMETLADRHQKSEPPQEEEE